MKKFKITPLMRLSTFICLNLILNSETANRKEIHLSNNDLIIVYFSLVKGKCAFRDYLEGNPSKVHDINKIRSYFICLEDQLCKEEKYDFGLVKGNLILDLIKNMYLFHCDFWAFIFEEGCIVNMYLKPEMLNWKLNSKELPFLFKTIRKILSIFREAEKKYIYNLEYFQKEDSVLTNPDAQDSEVSELKNENL